MHLDVSTRTAERFITELMREYYRHYLGLEFGAVLADLGLGR